MAVLAREDAGRVIQQLELDALGLGMLDFFLTGRQLVAATAVCDVHMLRAQTLRNARRVHRNVARADDGDTVEVLYRRIVIIAVCLHEVDAGQQLICGVHTQQVLAGNMQELRQTCAGADEHGLVAVREQLVHGLGLADDGVIDDIHAHGLEVIYFLCDYLLRQTELRDAVHQNAAGLMESFVNGDVVAHLSQVARAGQTRGAGADDRDAVAVGFGDLDLVLDFLIHMVVRDEALKTANADALALDAAHALRFALLLLRADAAADGRQGVGGGDDLIRRVEVALGDLCDELRDTHLYGAASAAERILTVEAALCLVYCHFGGVAKGDLVEITGTNNGILFGHGILGHFHISHCGVLPSFCKYALLPHPALPYRTPRA